MTAKFFKGKPIRVWVLVFFSLVLFMIPMAATFGAESNQTTVTDQNWPGAEWRTSDPKKQGIDLQTLSGSENVINNDYKAVTSLLVVRHGYLVHEKYYLKSESFMGFDKDYCPPVFLVKDSIISALIGIAIQRKFIKGIDQKISDIYPEYFKITDPRKKEITIKNLLTMTAGLEPVDNNVGKWLDSHDRLEYVINRPLVSNPGEKFTYNSGLIQLLGAIIAKSSQMSFKEFADKYLFSPLRITHFWWGTSKGDYDYLYLTPRDMAKFGYLYLMGGKWGDMQVVPEEWVKESTRVQVDTGDGWKYGYLWWLDNKRDQVHDKQISVFSATGWKGLFITVIPELDLVAVITSYHVSRWNRGFDTYQLITDYVIPSVR